VSACAWVYGGKQSASSRVVVKGADGKETYSLEFTNDDKMNFFVRDSNNKEPDDFKNYAVHGRVWQDDWIHLAGTYDGNSVKCYVNGEFQEALDANFVVTGAFTLSQDINDLAIGNRSDDDNRAFKGTIDEVRLYDYGLSAAEVAWLATEGTGYIPLTLEMNIYDKELPGKQTINFKDFAMLLEDWLKEGMWPPEE
ncbi:MAG: LamG domain-containing protein, partial [Planctomycetota bacterium]